MRFELKRLKKKPNTRPIASVLVNNNQKMSFGFFITSQRPIDKCLKGSKQSAVWSEK